ncbi:unnamed protein product [Cylindrotheca closterium]|uniref:Reverse transcriptase domain-containing protein n=1 Tax=Cylindrotheca closterium TaxID=2856 RepID=A0AAD2CF45_9STRA|nr:unnamed protein product [Cylindrotheca closterium]
MLHKQVYPLPKISDFLTDISGFSYASAIDFKMGYWNVRITPKSSKLCTITLPWGKCSYQKLPMGAMPSAYIFQEAMNHLMEGLGDVLTYLDGVLCVTKGDFEDHLQRLELCLQRLHKAGLKANYPNLSLQLSKQDATTSYMSSKPLMKFTNRYFGFTTYTSSPAEVLVEILSSVGPSFTTKLRQLGQRKSPSKNSPTEQRS